MNLPAATPLIRNEKKWYFFSLFYARENWAALIAQIIYFYQERQNQFCSYLISFSEERGENIQVIFVSSLHNENCANEIQARFQTFLDQNPSVRKTSFPYGKAVWGNYPNDSITWNKFKLIDYSEQYIRFHQQTMNVALKLLTDDFSSDSILSLGIYLFTKGLIYIADKEQKNVLSQVLQEVSTDFKNYSFLNSVTELIKDTIDVDEVSEAIESYVNENESDYSSELVNWLNEAKGILEFYDYSYFCTCICKILGLNGLHQITILELMNSWYNSDK